jgi:hypothetical protein
MFPLTSLRNTVPLRIRTETPVPGDQTPGKRLYIGFPTVTSRGLWVHLLVIQYNVTVIWRLMR